MIIRFRVEIKRSFAVFVPQRLFPVLCLTSRGRSYPSLFLQVFIKQTLAVVVEGEGAFGKPTESWKYMSSLRKDGGIGSVQFSEENYPPAW
jgi:hypothetical protein